MKIGALVGVCLVSLYVMPAFGFEANLYDGFFVEYGDCDIDVKSDLEFLEIMVTKIIHEGAAGSFCDLLENALFEYDYKTESAVLTKKFIDDKTYTPVSFYTSGFSGGKLPVILPTEWEKGDSLRYSFGQINFLEYDGVRQKIINDQKLDVYQFIGEEFVEDGNLIGQVKVTLQYETKTGFLVSAYHFARAANPFGGATVDFTFNAIDIAKPHVLSVPTGTSKGGGCLIATATFDTELSPQVQMLREIRDNALLETQAGKSFMEGFNKIYYSFSPTISDWERQNPIFKEAVKVIITPLLVSLSILNYVDLDSEKSVLGYGIGIILLNVGMYFVAPTIILWRLKK